MTTPPVTSIRLDRELKDRLRLAASGRHMPLGTLIKQVLWEWVRLELRRQKRKSRGI